MGLKKYFSTSSKRHTAIIDERLLICIEARNTDTMASLSDAIIKWKRYLNHKPQLKPWAVYKDYSRSHEVLYFTPYSAELFFKFYKQLIINHFAVPNTGGNTFHNTTVNVYLFYNTFSDTETTKTGRPVLDSCKKVGSYKDASILNDRFTSILVTMYSLIFYKNYTPTYFQQSGVDANEVYTGCVDLATFLEKVYLSEHRLPKDLLATMPTNAQFQAGHGTGILIPAFSLQSITVNSASSSNNNSAKASISARSNSNSSSSASKSAKSDISNSSQSTNRSSKDNEENGKQNKSLQATGSKNNKMISLGQFRRNYFPMTTHPEVIEQGIQMLMNERPGLFKSPVHFQKFHIDKAKQVPASLDDALRTGELNNQQYVIDADNQFRRIANEIIKGRQNVLELDATNTLIALIAGAYEKVSKKFSTLLAHANSDAPLTASSQKYYDKHYRAGIAKYNSDQQVELKTMKKAYYQEFVSKWTKEKFKIIDKYNQYKQKLSNNINKDTGVLFIKGRQQRNHEVHTQANSIKQLDLKKLGLLIKKYQVQFGHKMANDSKLIFEYLNHEYAVQHEKAKETVSELIKKQVRLNKSQMNLKQAQAEVKTSHNDTKLDKKLEKEQKEEQQYIAQLKHECADLRTKAKQYSSNSIQLKNKLTKAINQSHTLQSQLKNIDIQKKANQQLQKQNEETQQRYRNEHSKNQKQQSAFSNLQSSMAAQNKKASRDSYSNSVSASASASVAISQHDTRTYQKRSKLLTTIRTLRNNMSKQNVAAPSAVNSNKAASTEAALHQAYSSLHDFKLSVSTSDSIRQSLSASTASSAISTRNSYQTLISSLQDKLSQANTNNPNVNAQNLRKYSAAVTSYGTFTASLMSVSKSSSISTSNRIRSYVAMISSLQQENKSRNTNAAQFSPAVQQSMANQSYELSEARQTLGNIKASVKASSMAQSKADKINRNRMYEYNHQSSIRYVKSSKANLNISSNKQSQQQNNRSKAPNYEEPWQASKVVAPQYQQFSIQRDRQEKVRMEQQQMLNKTNQKYQQIQARDTFSPVHKHDLFWKN